MTRPQSLVIKNVIAELWGFVFMLSLRGVHPTKQSHVCMKEKNYFVYILTNKLNRVLYTGVTNDLMRRVYEHKNHLVKGFTQKYNVTKLVYFEQTQSVESAILREKQIKAGSRQKKIDLINCINPKWEDLYLQII